MRSESGESLTPGAAEPADATDPSLETVRPGQPTPGRAARVGPGADEALADPGAVGRRQREQESAPDTGSTRWARARADQAVHNLDRLDSR